MRGVRKRLTIEHEQRIAQAWQTGAFSGATQSKGGLKPLEHYLRRAPRKMNAKDMLAAMQSLAGHQNAKYAVN